MIENLFISLNERPGFRRLIWKPIYNFLAKRYGHVTSWRFMNYGYAFLDETNKSSIELQLKPEDKR